MTKLMSSQQSKNNDQKLAQLRAALEQYEQDGSDLFGHQAEEAKRPVRHRALLLLDQRARSHHELQERLLRLDFDPQVVTAVLAELVDSRLINDEEFAMEWVRQRHQYRGKSRNALDQELKQKGISAEYRTQALAQITDDNEQDRAWQLANKKAQQIKQAPDSYAERQKCLRRIVGVLARRGFTDDVSLCIAQEVLEERITELSA